LGGNTKFDEKIVSVFEPQTEIICKGKASKPTEFGKLVKVQEAENQIVTHYEVYDKRPADSALLAGAVGLHKQQAGTLPRIVAAHAGFYPQATDLREMGVKNVSVPNRNTRSEQRRSHRKKCRSRKVNAGARDAKAGSVFLTHSRDL
jgi:hypothetical protein